MAKVEARTWYNFSAKIPVNISIKEYTGAETDKKSVILGGKRLNLYLDSSIPYEKCDKITERTQLSLPRGYVLPITWVSERYIEYESYEGQLNAEIAAEILRQCLRRRLEEEVSEGEIVRTDYYLGTDGIFYTMRLTAECLEDIAETVEIPLKNRTGG